MAVAGPFPRSGWSPSLATTAPTLSSTRYLSFPPTFKPASTPSSKAELTNTPAFTDSAPALPATRSCTSTTIPSPLPLLSTSATTAPSTSYKDPLPSAAPAASSLTSTPPSGPCPVLASARSSRSSPISSSPTARASASMKGSIAPSPGIIPAGMRTIWSTGRWPPAGWASGCARPTPRCRLTALSAFASSSSNVAAGSGPQSSPTTSCRYLPG